VESPAVDRPAGPGAGPAPGSDPAKPVAGRPTPSSARISPAGRAKLRSALKRGLKVRLIGVPEGTKLRATRKGRVVAKGVARRGAATLRFSPGARRALRSARAVTLTVTAGEARVSLRLRR
jgi:hypothetical protein